MKTLPGKIVPTPRTPDKAHLTGGWTFTVIINNLEFTQTQMQFKSAVTAKQFMRSFVKELNGGSNASVDK